MKYNFVAIVGEANAGKSTFLNSIIGEKISIVSPKAQTTRTQIRGIKNIDDTQIIFIDTPGFCNTGTKLEKAINKNSKNIYRECDTILVMIDVTQKSFNNIFRFIENLSELKDQNIIVALNKIDIVEKEKLLSIASRLSKYEYIKDVFMISAKTKDGLCDIEKSLVSLSKDGCWFYDEDTKTDLPKRYRMAEITREKVFLLLKQELPYNIYVETELYKETERKVVIYQSIIVSRENQKLIVVGKNANMLREIKSLAIKDIKEIIPNKNITLIIFVKVKQDWMNNKEHLQNAINLF